MTTLQRMLCLLAVAGMTALLLPGCASDSANGQNPNGWGSNSNGTANNGMNGNNGSSGTYGNNGMNGNNGTGNNGMTGSNR